MPNEHPQFLGMLGMHGSYEANMAMNRCDLMVCLGARFDDRVTGRLDAFSPEFEEDPCRYRSLVAQQDGAGRSRHHRRCRRRARGHDQDLAGARPSCRRSATNGGRISPAGGRATVFGFQQKGPELLPQHAIKRLYELTRDKSPIISTEVGQHQMWAAQHFGFHAPNKWLTSGGLGTMGYGLPAAIGAQIAHPGALVHRYRRRSEHPDEHPGAWHRDAISPAGQGVHHQQ